MNSSDQLKVRFSNGQQIEFRRGKFDSWCIYLINSDGTETIPIDVEWFTELKKFSLVYGNQRIYSEIFRIYQFASKEIDRALILEIVKISNGYDRANQELIKILFVKFYYAFVAEENRANTVLGKRIKMLGIHQVLKENVSPKIAANFSKGMIGDEIKNLCSERGF